MSPAVANTRTSAVPAWAPQALFLLLFLAGRLWYFVDFPIGVVHPDSGSYFVVAEAIQRLEWPNVADRSPFLPIVMAVVFSVVDRIMALVYVQSALSYLAGAMMIRSVHALAPIASLPVALAFGAYFMDSEPLEHDTAVLSESLYTSLSILAFALLLKAFAAGGRARDAALSSTLMALVIYQRPGGMFFIVIYLMVLGYLAWCRLSWRQVAAVAVPFPALLLTLAVYNHQTIGAFVLSASDATEVSLITNLYWETDPSYPPHINEAIVRVQQLTAERNTPEEMAILADSWDFEPLYSLYLRGHYYGPHSEIQKVTGGRPEYRRWLLRISKDAIAAHPDRFFKHFVVMMAYYYKSIRYNTDFRQYLYNRIYLFWIEKHFSRQRGLPEMVRWGKEFADPGPPPAAVTIVDYDKSRQMDLGARILLEDTPLTRVYLFAHEWLRPVFATMAWSWAQVLVFVASLAVLLRSRLRHDGAFLVFLLVCAPLGNAMIVSLVEYSQPRYSYPMEWAYYVNVALLPLLVTGRRLLDPRPAGAAADTPAGDAV